MNYFILSLGVAIVVLVLVRLLVSIQQSIQRLRFNAQSDILSLELLEQKIASAKREYEKSVSGWNGYRKFEIARKEHESKDTCSFYLIPHDGKSIAPYKPGQHLTFRLNIPGREKPVIRCYSLSDCYCKDHYRITVKKVMPPVDKPLQPPGLVSSYFHEQFDEGDLVDVQAPNGNFVLDPHHQRPAVLIAGGVGITPILSMAKSIIAADSGREFYIFYGVRHGREHAFLDEIQELESNHNGRVIVCYSDPAKEDLKVEGQQFQHQGRISVELMRSYLSSTNFEFYMCGPPQMMTAMSDQLISWGVSPSSIFSEAFGPATIKKVASLNSSKIREPQSKGCKISFAKSGIEAHWNADSGNLLDFAQEHGIEIPSGCRAGNCGTCTIAIKSGAIYYQSEPGVPPEEGSCLACIANPDSDLVLDA